MIARGPTYFLQMRTVLVAGEKYSVYLAPSIKVISLSCARSALVNPVAQMI